MLRQLSFLVKAVLCSGFVVMTFVGCGGRASSPEVVNKAWVGAILAGDGDLVLELTCDEQLAVANAVNGMYLIGEGLGILGVPESTILDQLASSGVVRHLLLGEVIEVDVSRLDYVLEASTDTDAVVHVQGRLVVLLRSRPIAHLIDQHHHLTRHSGRWRWCGVYEPP